ncbi:hypothetical protein JXA40_09265, partial [bacterium]|nr:hypothetical protein [candidate division CSSED10-310 bacterium]
GVKSVLDSCFPVFFDRLMQQNQLKFPRGKSRLDPNLHIPKGKDMVCEPVSIMGELTGWEIFRFGWFYV